MEQREPDYKAVSFAIRRVLRDRVHALDGDQEFVAINHVEAFDWCIDHGLLADADRNDKLVASMVKHIICAWMYAFGFVEVSRDVALAELGPLADPDPNLLWFRRELEPNSIHH